MGSDGTIPAPDGSGRQIKVITADAVRALKLRKGDDVVAIIKSTEVMIGRTREPQDVSLRRSGRIVATRRTKRTTK